MKGRATFHGKSYEVVYFNRAYQTVLLKDHGCPFEAAYDEVKFAVRPKYSFHDSAPLRYDGVNLTKR